MSNSTIFDDVLRTIQERLPKLLIPLVNEVFHTSYSQEEEVTRLPEEYQEVLSKVVADSCNKIADIVYHVECQSKKDGSMILRMVEYDFMIALSDSIRNKEWTSMKFPRSCIIYLRSTKNTLSEERMKIEFADGQCITYKVPVLKLKEYSVDEIFEKGLLILLPYYIMNYEKELSKIATDEQRTKQLLEVYDCILARLSKATREDDTGIFWDVVKMMQRVMNHLLRKEPLLLERMGDVMGGKVMPLPSDELREAKAAGLEQGIIALIRTCKKLKATKEIVAENLVEEFSLTNKQANEAIAKYWEE